jgi:hypothetical protein
VNGASQLRYLGQKPKKREAQFCQFCNNFGWLGCKIGNLTESLTGSGGHVRAFKMYLHYGIEIAFGKGKSAKVGKNIVAFRSAKAPAFAERKATILFSPRARLRVG